MFLYKTKKQIGFIFINFKKENYEKRKYEKKGVSETGDEGRQVTAPQSPFGR